MALRFRATPPMNRSIAVKRVSDILVLFHLNSRPTIRAQVGRRPVPAAATC